MTGDPEVDRFLARGGVLVPVELTGPLLDLLRPLVASSGRRLTRELVGLLQALAAADLAMSACGPDVGESGTVDAEGNWVTSASASRRVGCSARHITRLAERHGFGRKDGRDWLIHLPSLETYLRHRGAA